VESKSYPKEAERFTKDTAEHILMIKHDHEIYRYLLIKKPGTSFYWYEVLSWPGRLVINGDMGSFVFSRLEDMFEFFRSGRDINPGYWAEKCVAGQTKEFSEEKFKRLVKEHADDVLEGLPEVAREGFVKAVKSELLDDQVYSNNEAHTLVSEFSHVYMDLEHPLGAPKTVEFYDTWEWDFSDYTPHFLWCCFGIRRAIEMYDKEKGVVLP